nr:dna topoisomerase 2 [Quercus suber]
MLVSSCLPLAIAKQLTENKEIQYVKQIVGLQQHKEYTNVKSLRYGHLMIMTDQDRDDSHIKRQHDQFYSFLLAITVKSSRLIL